MLQSLPLLSNTVGGKGTDKQVVDVEVVLNEDNKFSRAKVEKMVVNFLRKQGCMDSVFVKEF